MRYAVVPCSDKKLPARSRAGNLYVGPLFRSAILAARELEKAGELDGTLILSALHGLVTPMDVLEPYNVRMGDPGTVSTFRVSEQLQELGAGELLPLLPRAYDAKLRAAVACVNGVRRGYALKTRTELAELWKLQDNPLEGSRGILEQRGRLRRIREAAQSS